MLLNMPGRQVVCRYHPVPVAWWVRRSFFGTFTESLGQVSAVGRRAQGQKGMHGKIQAVIDCPSLPSAAIRRGRH
jgi:hypothetical protein